MKASTPRAVIRVADEVWICTALLHRENPLRDDFSVEEIVQRAKVESIAGALRPGVYVHAVQHCVANRAPNPGRYRMLFESGKNRRRLFAPGDRYHEAREGAKITPKREEIPEKHRPLLDWYDREYKQSRRQRPGESVLSLLGAGKGVWADEDPDAYVRRLREGWE